jgi:hypothetical protein
MHNFKSSANWCSPPPNPPSGGIVYINSTGNKFGNVCHGSDNRSKIYISCPWLTVMYEGVSNDSVMPGFNVYQLWVTTDTVRVDKVYFEIRFDSPILGLWVSCFYAIDITPMIYLTAFFATFQAIQMQS